MKHVDIKQKLLSISAHALRTCLKHEGFDISFEQLHKTHSKCTPNQIMLYQMSLNLHKLVNEHNNDLSFEHVTFMEQIICSRRQINLNMCTRSTNELKINFSNKV